MAAENQVTKGDIINHLIRQFGFTSYLEYNKFDGASYYHEIVCANKEIAYLPENSYLDAANIERLLNIAKEVSFCDVLSLPQLLERYDAEHRNKKFDIIFFDPIHVRPDVDSALKILPRLLNPGGVLVVHDCNPEHFALTTLKRRPGSWVGETFKAFAVFRHFNRNHAITVSEDFGVGLIWNQNLNLDYSPHFDLDYYDFASDKAEYIGLIDWPTFLARTKGGKASHLFAAFPQKQSIMLTPRQFDLSLQIDAAAKPAASKIVGESQIFWRSANQSFSEYLSLVQQILPDEVMQNLHFVFPAEVQHVHQIRVDVNDHAGSMQLHAISLLDAAKNEVWGWDGKPAIFERISNMHVFQSDARYRQTYLLANNNDPYFLMGLASQHLEQIGPGWQLQLQLSPLPDYFTLLLKELRDHAPSHTGLPAPAATPLALSAQQTELLMKMQQVQKKSARIGQFAKKLDHILLQCRETE